MSMQITIRKRLVSRDRQFALDIGFESDSHRIAMFGPSGAGKSLTLRAIAGLLAPDSGRIVLNGRTLFDSESGIDLRPRSAAWRTCSRTTRYFRI
jgi:molybdate transport system ATP-binding protein